ncbi:MAG: efflux RND transporter periplasmic adaptor subunit [Deltaproteobacteria bacterium]|nr:efflux RND transporter periplasmic adaptor subunit [Deltaproteobacteria bacterium]
MSPTEGLKEQLHSLRIDRDPPARPAPPPRGRRRALALLLLALLAAIVVAAYRMLAGSPLEVRVAHARVERADQPISGPVLSGSGYLITAEKYIAIGVRVPGRIERFLVEEGDPVEAGQLLAELDARDYRAQVGRAEASLRLARANRKLADADRERIRKLFADGITSRQEMDQADSRAEVASAAVAQAENELLQARANLDDTRLLSPVRGVVLAKLRGVGEIAVPGGFAGSGDLLRLADLSELRAEVDVSEADLANVHQGQAAEVVPDAYPQRRYRAQVVKLYPQINRQKGTLKVEVRVEQPDAHLLPDMSARVTFFAPPPGAAGPDAKPAVLIPAAALRRGPQGTYVWIVAEHRLRRTPVRVERETGAEVPVTSGLGGGEALVVGPEESLRDGAAVRVAGGG